MDNKFLSEWKQRYLSCLDKELKEDCLNRLREEWRQPYYSCEELETCTMDYFEPFFLVMNSGYLFQFFYDRKFVLNLLKIAPVIFNCITETGIAQYALNLEPISLDDREIVKAMLEGFQEMQKFYRERYGAWDHAYFSNESFPEETERLISEDEELIELFLQGQIILDWRELPECFLTSKKFITKFLQHYPKFGKGIVHYLRHRRRHA